MSSGKQQHTWKANGSHPRREGSAGRGVMVEVPERDSGQVEGLPVSMVQARGGSRGPGKRKQGCQRARLGRRVCSRGRDTWGWP